MSRITTRQRNDLNMYLNSYRTPAGTVPAFRYITLAGNLTSRGLSHDRRVLEIEHIFRNSPAVTPEFATNAERWLGRQLTEAERARVDPNHSTVYTTWTDTIRPLPQDIRNNLAASMTDVDPEYNALNELVSSGSAAAVDVVLRNLGRDRNTSDREGLEVASELDIQNTNAAALATLEAALTAQNSGQPVAPTATVLGPMSVVNTAAPNSVATAESIGGSGGSSGGGSDSGGGDSDSGAGETGSGGSDSGGGGSDSGDSGDSGSDIERFIEDVLGEYDFTDTEFDIFRDVLSAMTSSQRESTYREIRNAIEADDFPADSAVRALFGRALSGAPVERFLRETGDPLIRSRIYDFLHEESSDSGESSSTPSSPELTPLTRVFATEEESDAFYERLITRLQADMGTTDAPPAGPVTATVAGLPAAGTGAAPPAPPLPPGLPGVPGGPGLLVVPGGAGAVPTVSPTPGATTLPPYTGKGAIYHREAITVFFNDADHPVWDEELNANIDKAKYSQKDADDVIKNLVFTQGPKFLVGRPKTNGNIQELKEILQLWFSVQRSMSRGPRIPSVGISLGALLGSIGGALPVPPAPGSASTAAGATAGAMATSPPVPPVPTAVPAAGPASIVNLAKAWDNKSYGLGGAGHSHGPTTTAETFKVKEQAKIRMYQEAGPGLNEPLPRGIMALPVATAAEQAFRINHVC